METYMYPIYIIFVFGYTSCSQVIIYSKLGVEFIS
jgi:hypothetical protein